MVIYVFSIATCYVNSDVTEEIEFEDDVSEDELLESWKEWVWEQLDGGFSKVESED